MKSKLKVTGKLSWPVLQVFYIFSWLLLLLLMYYIIINFLLVFDCRNNRYLTDKNYKLTDSSSNYFIYNKNIATDRKKD